MDSKAHTFVRGEGVGCCPSSLPIYTMLRSYVILGWLFDILKKLLHLYFSQSYNHPNPYIYLILILVFTKW